MSRRFLGGRLVGMLLLLLAPALAEAQPCRYLLHDPRIECQELQQLERQTQELEDMRRDQYLREENRKREHEEERALERLEREQERRDERARCSPGYHDYYGLGCF